MTRPEGRGGPAFTLEPVTPPAAREALRLALSDRVRAQDLFAFVESRGPAAGNGSAKIRYYLAAPAFRELPDWLQRTVLKEVVKRRFEDAKVSPLVVASLLKPIAVEELGLLGRDADGCGARGPAHRPRARIGIPRRFHVPALPHRRDDDAQLLNAALEEKMSRISEVLLGSVTPFELMLGKLLASTSVSAVMTLVYLTGAAWTAHRWGYLDALDPRRSRGSSSSCCCRS